MFVLIPEGVGKDMKQQHKYNLSNTNLVELKLL